MRKVTLCAMMIFMMLSGTTTLKAVENEKNYTIAAPIESPEAREKILVDRLHEIKAMDMQLLNTAEKKELRKEVREIKSELKAGGVYLSVTAILIILLIVLLI